MAESFGRTARREDSNGPDEGPSSEADDPGA
jgi:hypothetical protein